MNRTKAREQAFLLIFEYDFHEDTAEQRIETAKVCRQLESNEYIDTTVKGVFDHIIAIDDVISKNIIGWTKDRLSKVAITTLRLALYEIKYADVPVSVAINEAVELAKEYGGEDDSSYINGVLGKIVRDESAEKNDILSQT